MHALAMQDTALGTCSHSNACLLSQMDTHTHRQHIQCDRLRLEEKCRVATWNQDAPPTSHCAPAWGSAQ